MAQKSTAPGILEVEKKGAKIQLKVFGPASSQSDKALFLHKQKIEAFFPSGRIGQKGSGP